MKNLIFLIILCILVSCRGGSGGGSSVAGISSCNPFALATDMVAVRYTGTAVTTVGTCNNGGLEYIIATDSDYNIAGSNTGWRLINSVLTTNAGNVNFTTGGRFQTADGVNEGHGLSFAGVDNTTCQNAYGVNGTADLFVIQVTAEFDSNCVPQLRGTWKEYSQCLGGNPEVVICSGTITLTR